MHALPGVGENLQDHRDVFAIRVQGAGVALIRRCNGGNQPKIGAEWLFGGTASAPATSLKRAGLFAAGRRLRPNIQHHFLPVAINYNGSNAVKEHGFQCHVSAPCVRPAAAMCA